jgi:hypothetical protein
MNERLKQLAEQAGLDAKEIRDDESLTLYAFEEFDIELFARLVRQDEREACAKLCEGGNFLHNEAPDARLAKQCAAAIRQRGEK